MDDQQIRETLIEMVTNLDPDAEYELRHEDFVADMPQSGERIRGRLTGDPSTQPTARSAAVQPLAHRSRPLPHWTSEATARRSPFEALPPRRQQSNGCVEPKSTASGVTAADRASMMR